jgi:hypothetical protein
MESGEQREQLSNMAAQWERMAEERLALIQRHPELALHGEHDEERTWAASDKGQQERAGA